MAIALLLSPPPQERKLRANGQRPIREQEVGIESELGNDAYVMKSLITK